MGHTEVIYEDSRTIAMDKREMERIYARRRKAERRRRLARRILDTLMFWRRTP